MEGYFINNLDDRVAVHGTQDCDLDGEFVCFDIETTGLKVMCVRSVYSRKADVRCFGKRLTAETPRTAAALFFLFVALFTLGAGLLSLFDRVPLTAALFETASAIGTVGLSLGVTPTLGAASRLVLIALMYFGRVGGLTLIYAAAGSHGAAGRHPPHYLSPYSGGQSCAGRREADAGVCEKHLPHLRHRLRVQLP